LSADVEGGRGGDLLLRGTEGKKGRREGTEREGKGIPAKVNESRIYTVSTHTATLHV